MAQEQMEVNHFVDEDRLNIDITFAELFKQMLKGIKVEELFKAAFEMTRYDPDTRRVALFYMNEYVYALSLEDRLAWEESLGRQINDQRIVDISHRLMNMERALVSMESMERWARTATGTIRGILNNTPDLSAQIAKITHFVNGDDGNPWHKTEPSRFHNGPGAGIAGEIWVHAPSQYRELLVSALAAPSVIDNEPPPEQETVSENRKLKETVSENRKLKETLLVAASHCQGGHSEAGQMIADIFEIPFPLTNDLLKAAAIKEGFEPKELWPWLYRK